MGEEGKKLAALLDRFHSSHPSIRIQPQTIPWGAAHEKLITAVVGDIPPDVAQMGTTWMPEFQGMGALADLSRNIQADPSIKSEFFFPGAWKTVEYENGVFGIPWYVETRCLFYRKDVLKKCGFEHPPRTWEELREIGAVLAKRPNGFGISLSPTDPLLLAPFIWQAGGFILDSKKDLGILEPSFRRGLEFFASLFHDGIAPLGDAADLDPVQAFSDKTATLPLFISGPWSVEQLNRQAPHLKGKWGVAPLPRGKTGASFLGGSDLVVFRKAKHPREAWEFVRFMAQAETQRDWYVISNGLPSRRDAWRLPPLKGNADLKPFGIQLKSARPTPMVPEWEQIGAVLARFTERVIHRTIDVPTALQKMDDQIRRILERDERPQSWLYKGGILLAAALLFGFLFFGYLLRTPKTSGKRSGDLTGIDLREHPAYKKSLLLFLSPALILLTIFLFLPVLASFLMSLTNYDIYSIADIDRMRVVNLENYKTILTDPLFWTSVKNTLIFAGIGGPLTICVSLAAALALERLHTLRAVFRTGFFLPVVTTLVAVAVVWKWIYHPRYGLLNAVLELLGDSPRDWLADPSTALGCLIAMAVWKNFGYNMVILLAGLQAIPRRYYEAAEIDGANGLRRFLDITLPLLSPTLLLVTIMTTIGYLQFFAEPYIMTDGGPVDSTLSVVLYLYRKGFRFYRLGEAAATSYILFLMIFFFSMGQILWARKKEA